MNMETNRGLKLPSNEDSFDEDALSDVDDEVFIKSSRNGFRNSNKDKTLQKPLMAPRQKREKKKVDNCFLHLSFDPINTDWFQKSTKNGRNGIHLMEIHTASPKGSPLLITVLYVAIAIGAIAGNYLAKEYNSGMTVHFINFPQT